VPPFWPAPVGDPPFAFGRMGRHCAATDLQGIVWKNHAGQPVQRVY
jgi:hypothetical protein